MALLCDRPIPPIPPIQQVKVGKGSGKMVRAQVLRDLIY